MLGFPLFQKGMLISVLSPAGYFFYLFRIWFDFLTIYTYKLLQAFHQKHL